MTFISADHDETSLDVTIEGALLPPTMSIPNRLQISLPMSILKIEVAASSGAATLQNTSESGDQENEPWLPRRLLSPDRFMLNRGRMEEEAMPILCPSQCYVGPAEQRRQGGRLDFILV